MYICLSKIFAYTITDPVKLLVTLENEYTIIYLLGGGSLARNELKPMLYAEPIPVTEGGLSLFLVR